MDKKTIKLGFCPIGKFVFSHEDAMRQKEAIRRKLDAWDVKYCTIDAVLPDGMVRDQKHVGPVVDEFRREKIDALFVPHCNFGTEGAVGMIARELGVPTLLWGPRDEAPLEDGSRLRDSLCGMLASSKVLRKLKVPFSYVENCAVEDDTFRRGFDRFMRAAAVSKSLRTMRIGQIGVRVDFFWTTIDNESELLERFGVQVVPIDMADFLDAVLKRAEDAHSLYEKELAQLKEEGLDTSALDTERGLINGLAMRDELWQIAAEENLDAFSIKSFTSIPKALGPGVGFGYGLTEERVPIAPEADLHGAISSVLLKAAAAVDEPIFSPEYTVRHPQNDNAVLLWHGSASWHLRHPQNREVGFKPPWILKNLPPSSPQFRLKDGPLTVCRFDGDTGEYVLGCGEGKTVDGPPTREFYAWMEVDDWPHWEEVLMQGPYIHHCAAVYEHCADVLQEAGRFIPGLKVERFDSSARGH